MKKLSAVVGLLAIVLVLSGCQWRNPELAAMPKEAKKVLKEFDYKGVPEALAAQHRIEALTINQVSGQARTEVVNKYSDAAVKGFKDGLLYEWHQGVASDQRVMSYAQKNDAGECVGFTAYYSLLPTGGKQKNNKITEIAPLSLCLVQPEADREANEKKEKDRVEELLKSVE